MRATLPAEAAGFVLRRIAAHPEKLPLNDRSRWKSSGFCPCDPLLWLRGDPARQYSYSFLSWAFCTSVMSPSTRTGV